MYLIHLQLGSPGLCDLPEQTAAWVYSAAGSDEGVEHVSLHADARPCPVLGMYLLAESLEQAEARAAAVCRRALAVRPELRGWVLGEVRAPLVAPFYEALLDVNPGRDGSGQGRFRPADLSSTPADLRGK
ncbi:hypothetical protein ACEZCY_15500 [Streptacidiphilus sp. N1-12]|uniref:Uncharacterized protein n=2 Tax=Streptacidiphilus alkalitolerans TaxID=3342712 RepID=A0ABV6VB40_9ACTN